MDVLFVGNSHTYYNSMPLMLVELVKAAKHDFSLEVEQCNGKGVSLEWHWKNPATREAIATRNWDYVVLQERSGGPLEEPASFHDHVQLLDREIKRQGAQTILYMTWANRSRPETQSRITEAYEQLGRKTGAKVVPVGRAWKRAQLLQPNFNLYNDDGRHANRAGSYLAACVFYAVLCRKSPEGLPDTVPVKGKKTIEINGSEALFYQRVAFETVGANLFSDETS